MGFTMRTSKPGAGNKFYITTSKGGYSHCIQGKPTDSQCNVLANCVGYACGRFNEIIGSMKYPYLNCNAENFIERAKNTYGLQVVSYPTLGGIMVWQKGDTLSGSDGAGHVAIVERLDSANQIYTSESGYGSSAFWNSVRNNSNGRWGLGSGYKFRGCIINPAIGDVHWVDPEPTPGEIKIGDEVIINGALYVSSNATSPAGSVSNRKTRVTRIAKGSKHPYNTTGDLGWMDASSVRLVNNYLTGNYKTLYNMNVRTGAGTNNPVKKVKDLTADGKRNATSTNPEANAVYKTGTIFTALQIINNNGVWAKTPSGYVCIQGESGTKYCSKI